MVWLMPGNFCTGPRGAARGHRRDAGRRHRGQERVVQTVYVGHDDRRFRYERAGYGDALFLAAGKFGGRVMHAVAEADQRQQAGADLADLARHAQRERVRLRLVNGSAMTYFDVRIPGLKMTVVQADGNNVQPVAALLESSPLRRTRDALCTARTSWSRRAARVP